MKSLCILSIVFACLACNAFDQVDSFELSLFGSKNTEAPMSDEDAATETSEYPDNELELTNSNQETNIATIDKLGGESDDRLVQGSWQYGINSSESKKVYIADNVPMPAQSEFLDYESYPRRKEEHDSYPKRNEDNDPHANVHRSCQEGQYLCRKASSTQTHIRCIPNSWKCNGVRDCEENDDEEGCELFPHRVQNSCSSHQHTCYGSGINGIPSQCVDKSKICDGRYDCTYGDDESNCAQRQSSPSQHGQNQVPSPITTPHHEEGQFVGPTHTQYQPNYGGQQNSHMQPPHVECPTPSRSEEYIKRLEWLNRCYRSCMKNPL